jgi:mRNA-degrading endonuclease RelE of RelBE toxin-antitoxin system
MRIEYTSRYLRDYRDIRDPRAKKATDAVEKKINESPNLLELFKVLDIQKYNPDLGGYRIRYSGKPEYRIRFDLLDDPEDPKEKIILLQLVLPREKYQKYAHSSINESVDSSRLKIVITESQLQMLKQLQ